MNSLKVFGDAIDLDSFFYIMADTGFFMLDMQFSVCFNQNKQ